MGWNLKWYASPVILSVAEFGCDDESVKKVFLGKCAGMSGNKDMRNAAMKFKKMTECFEVVKSVLPLFKKNSKFFQDVGNTAHVDSFAYVA